MMKYTKSQVVDLVIQRVGVNGLRKTAKAAGLDPGYLCRALNGRDPLSDAAAIKLGFERMETLYTRKK